LVRLCVLCSKGIVDAYNPIELLMYHDRPVYSYGM
jgi:hypothetical protein